MKEFLKNYVKLNQVVGLVVVLKYEKIMQLFDDTL